MLDNFFIESFFLLKTSGYIDPGSASAVFAIIIGLSISALVYFSLWSVFNYYGIVN